MLQTTEAETKARRAGIVTSATGVFLRYGYSRTTMAELAAAANLSRPTLYESFASKDDLFAEVIHHLSQQTIERYRATLQKRGTLKKQLHFICEDWATHGLQLIERHPDAKDLFDLRFAAVQQMYEDFIAFLVEVLSQANQSKSIPVEKILRNLVFSFSGLKQAAKDIKQMKVLVELQVDIFYAMLAPEDSHRS